MDSARSPAPDRTLRDRLLLRHSLRWRLPFVFGTLILVLAAVFLLAVQREIEGVLVDAGFERVDAAAEQIAGMLGGSVGGLLDQTGPMAELPAVRDLLRDPSDATRSAVRQALLPSPTPALRRIEVWDTAGGLVLETDYGDFRVPNLSPDPEAGIGGWVKPLVATFLG
jgi:hypothetical protein